MNKGIVLLSGGLDSTVSLASLLDSTKFELALTFDYGQMSAQKEADAAYKIACHYGIEHRVIKLDWLAEITKTSLVSGNIPKIDMRQLDNIAVTKESCENVWVPNRNGLFINIAASFADSMGGGVIVIGANKEEGATFSDNSKEFIQNINLSLEKSTAGDVKAAAPLIDLNKEEIVQRAIDLNVPLKYINSCYKNTEKHCGTCESCSRLKRALIKCGKTELLKELF